jgi:hypothetical protein
MKHSRSSQLRKKQVALADQRIMEALVYSALVPTFEVTRTLGESYGRKRGGRGDDKGEEVVIHHCPANDKYPLLA